MSDHVCRRLILFLDGTWNEDDESHPATSVVHLRERLFWGLNARLRVAAESTKKQGRKAAVPNQDARDFAKLPAGFRKKGISGYVFEGYEYLSFYDRGVGTGAYFDAIKGGMFGDGLDQNIREAYRFLCTWYRPGDEIFVYGFSRGAFTARSLCGYLQAVGLLRCEHCTPENEAKAWAYYRTPPGDRLSGVWSQFRRALDPSGDTLVHDSRYMRVRLLGIFDTVGALGIPENAFRKINQTKYGFHDTEINSLVDIRLHAVALDEPRHAFGPTMWTKPKFKVTDPDKSPTEQVWFAGAHSDVGGGYVNWTVAGTRGLSTLPLAWMLQRTRQLVTQTRYIADPMPVKPAVDPNPNAPVPFFDFDLLDDKHAINPKLRELAATAEQHMPWAPLYLFYPRNRRVINQMVPPNQPALESTGRVAFADPICEFIHASALERFNQDVRDDKGRLLNGIARLLRLSRRYRPGNLIDVIPYVAATYVRNKNVATPWRGIAVPIFTWKEMRIVDWSGRALDPAKDDDAKRAFALLPKPGDIGVLTTPAAMALIRDPRVPLPVVAVPAK
ncbi:MAG: DUF2235 domain-containing protein [Hyphomicrobiales bacterium]|nr:DUF2235 domain-containing protein [Hyphomicrobiales bacterium]